MEQSQTINNKQTNNFARTLRRGRGGQRDPNQLKVQIWLEHLCPIHVQSPSHTLNCCTLARFSSIWSICEREKSEIVVNSIDTCDNGSIARSKANLAINRERKYKNYVLFALFGCPQLRSMGLKRNERIGRDRIALLSIHGCVCVCVYACIHWQYADDALVISIRTELLQQKGLNTQSYCSNADNFCQRLCSCHDHLAAIHPEMRSSQYAWHLWGLWHRFAGGEKWNIFIVV